MLSRKLRNELTCLVNLGSIELTGLTYSLREVRRTEEYHIDTGKRADLLKLGYGLGILNLYDCEALLVSLLYVIKCIYEAVCSVGVSTVERTAAE